MGVGIGIAATTISGVASKAQAAGSTTLAAANSAPQSLGSSMDAASATSDTFSFVDNAEIAEDVSANMESISSDDEQSEFEGLGSMFD